MSRPARHDPYKSFTFKVMWDGRYVAGVSQVSGLQRTPEVVEHRESGAEGSRHGSPGDATFEAITLARGITHDPEFEQWAGSAVRKDLTIDLFDEAGQKVRSYRVFRAWVSEFQAMPDLDASANAVALEHVKLEHEGWGSDDSSPPSP